MIFNRSVPTDILLPHISYPDVAEAIAWLTRTFGFTDTTGMGNPVNRQAEHRCTSATRGS
jgi:uncharacterized glyoxalase superfamily protein PhnB